MSSKNANANGKGKALIIHHVARGALAPSISPFPLKLETFVRATKIPYQNDFKAVFSSKGKTPWITYMGQDVADSQFAIEHLKVKCGVDLNKGLSEHDIAIATSLQRLTEDSLYWCMCYETFTKPLSVIASLMPYGTVRSYAMAALLKYRVTNQLWQQGTGRHTAEEVKSIARRDIKALSQILGEKPYFLGQQPTEIDCCIFGMLSQIRWHMKGFSNVHEMIKEYPNLWKFCSRVRDQYWPDWQECITNKDAPNDDMDYNQ